jgi:hypothetical protein
MNFGARFFGQKETISNLSHIYIDFFISPVACDVLILLFLSLFGFFPKIKIKKF